MMIECPFQHPSSFRLDGLSPSPRCLKPGKSPLIRGGFAPWSKVGHGEAVFFESGDVPSNSLFDVGNGILFGLSLADTAGRTWTFDDPESIFTRINDDLPHILASRWGSPAPGHFLFSTNFYSCLPESTYV